MALKLDLLNSAAAIVDKKFKPTPQFMLFWQRQATAIQNADAGQQQLLEMIQAQQTVIVQLLGVVAANVVYLNDLSAWQQEFGNYTLGRVSYLQIAVATLATATGTTLPTPDPPLPPWPGPPPEPPF